MKRKPQPKVEQPMPEELVAGLVDFVYRKFYRDHPDTFAKDKGRLLQWVIFAPAKWLHERGVTLPPSRYKVILERILMDALANCTDFAAIKYLPGFLKVTIERHFAMHGDEYYDEAKNIRNLADNALAVLGKLRAPERDAVAEMVNMCKLLKAARGKVTRVTAKMKEKQKELF